MKKFRVGLVYNLAANVQSDERDDDVPWDKWYELDTEYDVEGYESALRAGGHEVVPMEGNTSLPDKLEQCKVDICFNTCEGHRAKSREAQVPALLDMLGIPYTGSGVMSLAIGLDKSMTKRILQFYGVPTPKFQVFVTGEEPIDPRLNFPLFVKPSSEGSGIGITAKSICATPRQVRERVRFTLQSYKEPALVEEYIPGREITVGLVGNVAAELPWLASDKRRRKTVLKVADAAEVWALQLPLIALNNRAHSTTHQLEDGRRKAETHAVNSTGKPAKARTYRDLCVFPPLEIDMSTTPPEEGGVYDSAIKGRMNDAPKYFCPAFLTEEQVDQLSRLSAATFTALECFDFARVDFRVRADDGKPFVLEINPLPGITRGVSDMVMAAEAVGVDYETLINSILLAALKRYGLLGD
jgi:D-alanine-D-alanine ligase